MFYIQYFLAAGQVRFPTHYNFLDTKQAGLRYLDISWSLSEPREGGAGSC